MAPLLELDQVGHTYGARRVLDGVSLQLRRGEFVALLGPSGSGKTTLMRCIGGLLRPAQGQVRVDGLDPLRHPGRVAMVFQQFNLVRRLSALDNVLAGRLGQVAAWRGMLRRFSREDRLWALHCLERVGLLAHATQRADTLSGGQQQRVAIARALAQRAALIVADEPVASLDPAISAGILTLLQRIAAEDGVAVLCSLHQLHLARAHAQRLIGLADGHLQFDRPVAAIDDATTEALYRSPAKESAWTP